jgi:hypothetical protein
MRGSVKYECIKDTYSSLILHRLFYPEQLVHRCCHVPIGLAWRLQVALFNMRMIHSLTWRRMFKRFFLIEIFQSARVCLVIYGQRNVCLCIIATVL